MERRNFIRTLLAGLALAPVAKYLIDIPTAQPPPISVERMRAIVAAIQRARVPTLIRPGEVDVYPVLVVNRPFFASSFPLEGPRDPTAHELAHYIRPTLPRRSPLADMLADAPPYRGLDRFKARAEREASSFAAWDRRVGKALLS